MIIRVFRVEIHQHLIGEFEKDFESISVPLVKKQDGLVSLFVGKPLDSSSSEYMLTTIWENLAALKIFCGDNWQQPIIPEGMEKYAVQCSLQHYIQSLA